MRLRATRLTAASNPRRRLLDPARLFQTAGRVGVCYTSDTGGVSWDDLIAENMRAMGPELVVNGTFDDGTAGWSSSAATLAIEAGALRVTQAVAIFASARQLVSGLVPGRSYTFSCTLRSVGGSLPAVLYARPNGYDDPAGQIATPAVTSTVFVAHSAVFIASSSALYLRATCNSGTVTGAVEFDNISVREIDLSKCTLYHDSAATVPVVYPIAAGQGMGFLRDRSAGSELGPELVTNGTFDANVNGWNRSLGGVVPTWSGGTLRALGVGAGTGFGSNDIQLTAGRFYEMVLDIKGDAAYDNIRFTLRTASTPAIAVSSEFITSVGTAFRTVRAVFQSTATAANGVVFCRFSGNEAINIDNASLRELPGYPLSQPTLSARGEFSRRFNQLLATATLSTQSVTTIATTYRLLFSGAGTVTLSGTATGTLSAGSHTITATAGTLTLTVSGAVTEADLRFAADAHIGKPYQRVTTASNYDEEGFPTYLRRQTDDWARAFAVNPAGATKALAFWAGQKMSDAATGVLIEASEITTTGSGKIAIFGPNVFPDAGYRTRSRGSSNADADALFSGFRAPGRHVARVQTDITNDVNQLSINGSLAASSTADQGTGTYLTHDLFEGARGGTSLFANTRTYTPPLLMYIQPDDPGPTASEIARLEAKYLRAAGVVS
jgi:hypothetical protein